MQTRDTVVVVGAGPSGLEAVRVLRDAGIPVQGFERHSDVGGIWDIDNPGTPMYASAHFISSRTLSALAGAPFPDDYPDYPRHDQLLAYLRDYADRFDLRRHIRFGTEVADARPVDGGWDVTVGDGEVIPARAVVLATGNQWHPNLPDYPGTFTGETFHSRDYRSPEVFRGKRVLIVGAGNSGCDIACDAARAADHAVISMRRGYRIVPKHLFGKPADVFAHEGPNLPAWLEQRAFTKLLDLLVGDVTRYGLPAPDHDVLATHPILNSEMLDLLAHGDLEVRRDIARLDGDEVAFVDGTRETFDLIVWATGYRVRFPVIDREALRWRHPNAPDLFLNVFPPDRDDLFVMGMLETDAGAWPIISRQAQLIVQVLGDQRDRPAQAETFRALKRRPLDLEGGIHHVDSDRHAYYVRDETYRRTADRLLAAMAAGRLDELDLDPSGLRRAARSVRSRIAGMVP